MMGALRDWLLWRAVGVDRYPTAERIDVWERNRLTGAMRATAYDTTNTSRRRWSDDGDV